MLELGYSKVWLGCNTLKSKPESRCISRIQRYTNELGHAAYCIGGGKFCRLQEDGGML